MLLVDVIQQMTRSQRMLRAHRWGVEGSAPMVLAERLLVEDVAARLVRRMAKAGAPNLGRLLIEHTGASVSVQDSLASEAAVLRDWGVLIEEGERWSLPVDLAIAARTERKLEHFYLGSLLNHTKDKALRALADSLGVSLGGGPVSQRVRVRQAILGSFDPSAIRDDVRAGVEELQALGTVSVGLIRGVVPVEAAAGQLFDVSFDEGVRRIAPRDLALALGMQFAEISIEGVRLVPLLLDRVQMFPSSPVGAVVTFLTPQMCEQAMHSKKLQEWAHEVAGARLLVRAGVDLEVLRGELLRLGFESEGMELLGGYHAGAEEAALRARARASGAVKPRAQESPAASAPLSASEPSARTVQVVAASSLVDLGGEAQARALREQWELWSDVAMSVDRRRVALKEGVDAAAWAQRASIALADKAPSS